MKFRLPRCLKSVRRGNLVRFLSNGRCALILTYPRFSIGVTEMGNYCNRWLIYIGCGGGLRSRAAGSSFGRPNRLKKQVKRIFMNAAGFWLRDLEWDPRGAAVLVKLW